MDEFQTTFDDALIKAVTMTIEDLVFQQVRVYEDETEAEENIEKVWAILPLKTPHQGEILLEMPLRYARSIAQEVYGFTDEEDCSEEVINDSLAELVNAVSGKFFNFLLLPDQKFELGFPKTGTGKAPELEDVAVERTFIDEEDIIKATLAGFDFVNQSRSSD